MDLTRLLGQLQLFAELEEEALERLAARCVSRNVPEGHVLFTAGQECRGLYIVESGRVRIFRVSNDGREQVLHIEGAGRAIAELPLLDGGTYPASAVTLEKSRLIFLPREDFEYLYRTHPDIAHAIIRALARRLRHLVHVTETLAFRDVAARLAMLLAGYAERGEPQSSGGVLLRLDRTQEELALEIGTARESVSRAMKQLRRKGLISPAGHRQLKVPDVEALRVFARGARPM